MTQDHNGPKLPAKQLAILAVARFAEPLAMTSVFPYLPEMIASFDVPEKDVAKWAGVTSAVFSLAKALPLLAMAITVRAVQGASNGNVGIIRTMVAELVPEKELQPRAFSIMPLVWSVGSIFGPAFGGLFAKPAQQFPSIFGDSAFFLKYPFALPNMLGSVIFLVSVTTGTLFLRETLASKRHARDWGLVLGERLTGSFKRQKHQRQRRFSFQDDEASAPLLQADVIRKRYQEALNAKTEKPARPSMKSVFSRHSFPYFLHFSPQKHDESNTRLPFYFSGGYGLESGRIGTINMSYGIVCGLVQFLLFPPLCSYFGTLKCFRGCAVAFPIVYMLTPYTVLIESTPLRYAALATVMVLKAGAVIIGFPCTTILLTNSASSLTILGTLNGFATTFSGLGRAAGPAMAGAAFSWGVKRGIVSVPYWILAAIAAVGAIPAWWIVEGDGPSGSTPPSQEDSEAEDSDGTAIADEDSDVDAPLATSSRSQPRTIGDEARRRPSETQRLNARRHDSTSHEPNAGDDLPLVGSWKSSQGIKAAAAASSAGYGSIDQRANSKKLLDEE
ncbi:major facilitator superfamily transporter [Apiospora phragmitis]|uniref:Major facilitator superfamily transporter n=1 Tax=Apiospora phragmitis TaxID=2905665 RepID=A0ABR1URN2_9PEZI